MKELMKVLWDDIADAAAGIFNIWSGQPELKWAEDAWRALEGCGLTSYGSEVERHKVLMHLLTLGTIYYQFCSLAWDEEHEIHYVEWAEDLGIDSLRVGQIIGPKLEDDEEEDPQIVLELAISELVVGDKNKVRRALESGMGGEQGVFVALWASKGDEENPDEILNVVTPDKMRAFEWISQGMSA
jgi:hypothetical protein